MCDEDICSSLGLASWSSIKMLIVSNNRFTKRSGPTSSSNTKRFLAIKLGLISESQRLGSSSDVKQNENQNNKFISLRLYPSACLACVSVNINIMINDKSKD